MYLDLCSIDPSLVLQSYDSGALVPLAGVVLLALPYSQLGVRTHTLMTPSAAVELSTIAGTAVAVLASAGQRKLLFGFASEPTDARGVASWSRLGFIKHGPSGNYTLTFALAGLMLATETAPVSVRSSVATVSWENAPSAYNVSVCTSPSTAACSSMALFGSFGAPLYQEDSDTLGYGFPSGALPSAPSGVFLPVGPTLGVFDADGNVLAGKIVSPIVLAGRGGSDAVARAIVVREFPHAGASSSVLSWNAYSAAGATSDGQLRLLATNLRPTDTDSLDASVATGRWGGHMRVVTAPRGASTGLLLALRVDGVEASVRVPLTVVNHDLAPPTDAPSPDFPANQCAFLDIVESPSRINVTWRSASLLDSPFDRPFKVVARNSAGDPIAGVQIAMAPVDTAGMLLYRPINGSLSSLDQTYVSYLQQNGGAPAFLMGNLTATWFGEVLQVAIILRAPRSSARQHQVSLSLPPCSRRQALR